MASGSMGMSGHNFDAFVSSQRTFNDYDLAAKIQEKYWRARQKFLAKVEKKEDDCIVLSDSKLDAKLEIYRSIDKSCASLTNILESYQNCLFVYANEENSFSILLKECSKHDKTKAGKIMSIVGKSLSQSSHQRIRLYMPLLRVYQEMETFHSRAVDDTAETVQRLESRRSQYRASLLWMKDLSERLDPDVYRQLDKFRRVQNHVRNDKKAFDSLQMDVVQKIDLLMASRCNLMNQILASYQAILLETFERNYNNFRSMEELIKKEDIYEYEFKTLKQLNPLKISSEPESICEEAVDLIQNLSEDTNNNNNNEPTPDILQEENLIDVSLDSNKEPCDGLSNESDNKLNRQKNDVLIELDQELDELDTLFGNHNIISTTKAGTAEDVKSDEDEKGKQEKTLKRNETSSRLINPNLDVDLLLNMDSEEQVANLLGPSHNSANFGSSKESASNDEKAPFDLDIFSDSKTLDDICLLEQNCTSKDQFFA